jgi:hypothetical protein
VHELETFLDIVKECGGLSNHWESKLKDLEGRWSDSLGLQSKKQDRSYRQHHMVAVSDIEVQRDFSPARRQEAIELANSSSPVITATLNNIQLDLGPDDMKLSGSEELPPSSKNPDNQSDSQPHIGQCNGDGQILPANLNFFTDDQELPSETLVTVLDDELNKLGSGEVKPSGSMELLPPPVEPDKQSGCQPPGKRSMTPDAAISRIQKSMRCSVTQTETSPTMCMAVSSSSHLQEFGFVAASQTNTRSMSMSPASGSCWQTHDNF